jgi:hypothetical protein
MQKTTLLGKAGKALAVGVLLLGGSLLVNTLRLPALPSSDSEAPAAPADLTEAVALAAAIRMPVARAGDGRDRQPLPGFPPATG